jgi:glycerol-3-phosphate dehydrogenase subunit C
VAESIGLRVSDPRFWDAAQARQEIDRVFDICESCRLCFKFCGSFPLLFEKIDEKTSLKREEYLRAHPELAREAQQRRHAATTRAEPREVEHGLEIAETFGDELPELAAHAHDLSAADIDAIVDRCFQCKLCYPNCPYTPPHDYALDFPRLLLRWKAIQVRRTGTPWTLRLLRSPTWIGWLGSLAPRLLP